MAASDQVCQNDKRNILAVLLSKPTGVAISQFERDYKQLLNSRINYKRYGFKSTFEMLKSIPDIVRIEYNEGDGQQHLFGVPDSDKYNGYLPISFREQLGKEIKPGRSLTITCQGCVIRSFKDVAMATAGSRPLNMSDDGRIHLIMSRRGDFSLVYPRKEETDVSTQAVLDKFREFDPCDSCIIPFFVFVRFKDKKNAIACLKRHGKELHMKPANENVTAYTKPTPNKSNHVSDRESNTEDVAEEIASGSDQTSHKNSTVESKEIVDEQQSISKDTPRYGSIKDKSSSPVKKKNSPTKVHHNSGKSFRGKKPFSGSPASKGKCAIKSDVKDGVDSERRKYLRSFQSGAFPVMPGQGYKGPTQSTSATANLSQPPKKPVHQKYDTNKQTHPVNKSTKPPWKHYPSLLMGVTDGSDIKVSKHWYSACEVFMGNINKCAYREDMERFFYDETVLSMRIHQSFSKMYAFISFNSVEDGKNYIRKWNGNVLNDRVLFCAMNKIEGKKVDRQDRPVSPGMKRVSLENDASLLMNLTSMIKRDVNLNTSDSALPQVATDDVPLCEAREDSAEIVITYPDSPPGSDASPASDMPSLESCDLEDKDEGLCLDSVSTTSMDTIMTSSVFVFNFPHFTKQADLLHLFSPHKPSSVSIINNSDLTKSTQALVTLGSAESARAAAHALDQSMFCDKSLTVACVDVSMTHPHHNDMPVEPGIFQVYADVVRQHWPRCDNVSEPPAAIEVLVTYVLDDYHFWGIPSSNDISKLVDLEILINEDYCNGKAAVSTGLCGAVFDGHIYRAWAYERSDDKASVLYLDWGNEDEVGVGDTRLISDIQAWFMPPASRPFQILITGNGKVKLECNGKYLFNLVSFSKHNLMSTVEPG